MPDQFKNSAHSFVLTAPVPATSGTTVTVQSGHGARFPATPFNLTIWPVGAVADIYTNAEICTCTNIAGDVLTIVREQEGTSARTVLVGDAIAQLWTAGYASAVGLSVKLAGAVGDGATDDSAAIEDAVDRLPTAGGEVWFPPGTYRCNVTVTKANVRFRLHPGATLEKQANGTLIDISGNGFEIHGGTLNGRKASVTGRGIQISATDYRILGVTLSDMDSRSIALENSSRGLVSGNRITGQENDSAVFVDNGGSRITITDNDITSGDTSDSDCIAVHAKTAGRDIADIVIANNRLFPNSVNAFGIEAGTFGGDSADRITITGNTIHALVASYGGISIGDGCTNVTLQGNIYNANGLDIQIGAYEIATTGGGGNIALIGNIAKCGTACPAISFSRPCSSVSIIGNILEGHNSGVSSVPSSSIHISLTVAGTIEDVVVADNIIKLPAADTSTERIGVWIQSNHASAIISGIHIHGNVIIGDDTADTLGINFAEDVGVQENVRASNNMLTELAQGIRLSSGIGLPVELVDNHFASVTTRYGGTAPSGAVVSDLLNKTASRFKASNGTALVAGDFSLHANFGTGASVSTIAATDQGGRVTITSGTTAGASPTATLTFKDGTWTAAPAVTVSRGDTNAVAAGTGEWRVTSVSATVAVFTFVGTPNDSTAYILDFVVMGR